MTILVTGARGGVGRAVVDELLAAGVQVRAASRRPEELALPDGVVAVPFDQGAPDTLPAALSGIRKVFLNAEDGALPDPLPRSVVELSLAGSEG